MFIFLVYFVNLCLFVVQSEDNVINIEIRKEQPRLCRTERSHTLVESTNFTLNIHSEYPIIESSWKRKHNAVANLNNLKNSIHRVIFVKSIDWIHENESSIYEFSHIEKVKSDSGGHWKFFFHLAKEYGLWPTINNNKIFVNCSCHTFVSIVSAKDYKATKAVNSSVIENKTDNPSLAIISSVFGVLVLALTIYVVYLKRTASGAKKNNYSTENLANDETDKLKVFPEHKVNIADRPQLPLPDEAINGGSTPPASPVSKRFPIPAKKTVHNNYKHHETRAVALSPKRSYRNRPPEEAVISPVFSKRRAEEGSIKRGPILPVLPEPKQHKHFRPKYLAPAPQHKRVENNYNNFDNHVTLSSHKLVEDNYNNCDNRGPVLPPKPVDNNYKNCDNRGLREHYYRNNALDVSEEEDVTPSLARSQIQDKLMQLPPVPDIGSARSFKNPKPTPRLSPPPLKKAVFQPVQRPEPIQRLSSMPLKKAVVLPVQRPAERESYDDEWQYEVLQPSSNYLGQTPA